MKENGLSSSGVIFLLYLTYQKKKKICYILHLCSNLPLCDRKCSFSKGHYNFFMEWKFCCVLTGYWPCEKQRKRKREGLGKKFGRNWKKTRYASLKPRCLMYRLVLSLWLLVRLFLFFDKVLAKYTGCIHWVKHRTEKKEN